MDIDRSEWDALPNMLADGVLNNVKQLGIEIHMYSKIVEDLHQRMELLKRLETLGFKKWYCHRNAACTRGSEYVRGVYLAFCIEMVYINTNFLTAEE